MSTICRCTEFDVCTPCMMAAEVKEAPQAPDTLAECLRTFYPGETNPLTPEMKERHNEREQETVYWTDKRLVRIDRLRFLSDPGFPDWELSYCYGTLKDGASVFVQLHESLYAIPKRRQGGIKGAVIEAARQDRVFAKGLGILDVISTLC